MKCIVRSLRSSGPNPKSETDSAVRRRSCLSRKPSHTKDKKIRTMKKKKRHECLISKKTTQKKEGERVTGHSVSAE